MFDVIKQTRIHQQWCYVKYTVFSPIFEPPQRRRRCTSTTEKHNKHGEGHQTFSIHSNERRVTYGGPSAQKRRRWRQLYEEAGRRASVSTRRTSIDEVRSSSSDEGQDLRTTTSMDMRRLSLLDDGYSSCRTSTKSSSTVQPPPRRHSHVISFRNGVRNPILI